MLRLRRFPSQMGDSWSIFTETLRGFCARRAQYRTAHSPTHPLPRAIRPVGSHRASALSTAEPRRAAARRRPAGSSAARRAALSGLASPPMDAPEHRALEFPTRADRRRDALTRPRRRSITGMPRPPSNSARARPSQESAANPTATPRTRRSASPDLRFVGRLRAVAL